MRNTRLSSSALPPGDGASEGHVKARIAVTVEGDVRSQQRRAEQLAGELNLPMVSLVQPDTGDERYRTADAKDAYDFLLVVAEERLELREAFAAPGLSLVVDFATGETGYRRRSGRSRRQPLARAVGLRGRSLRILDATAGLGRDAFLLACLGCEVIAVERCAVLAALLRDGLARASTASDRSLAGVVERIKPLTGDARDVIRSLSATEQPDVIYLDPMYPVRSKSALAKKEMRMCRRLVGADEDAADLLAIARRSSVRRIVVKRHRFAPPLASGASPQYVGRRVRYDAYLRPGRDD